MALRLSRALHRRAAVVACGAVLVAPIPVLATTAAAAPAAGTVAVADPATVDHSLHLQGASNARDLGGYRTANGQTVRSGLVFRSNSLTNLTNADLARLQKLNLRTIVDFRTLPERTLQPDRVPAGAADRSYDVFGSQITDMSAMVDMNRAYPQMATTPQANAAFRNALLDVAYKPGALLYHCSSGKDRTGWMSAVLLTILGVPRTTVDEDYLLSNKYLGGNPHSENPLVALSNSVNIDWLNSAFAAVNQKYGNFDNYVSKGLQLKPSDVTALKAKLLA